jgi:hypothetical protein
LIYPQLSSGALAQFPLKRRHRKRTLVNDLPDNTTIKLQDPWSEIIEWQLVYSGLSDGEATSLEQFFEATEGNLAGFTFLDPTANLFACSDDLVNVVWNKAPFLSLTGGVGDPSGGSMGWHLSNSGSGQQAMSQTLSAPGNYIYTFSLYSRGSERSVISLRLGARTSSRVLSTEWQRVCLSAAGEADAETTEFGIEVPAGASVDLFGFQVEAQPAPSAYKPSQQCGVYEGTTFKDDTLSIIATDVHRYSATVNLLYAVSL